MAEKSGQIQLIGAAVVAVGFIVGGAIIASALNGVGGEIEETRASLTEIKTEIASAKGALKNVARAPAAAPKPQRRGPDPSKRYDIDVAGSPTLGPDTARVTIVEFSDFQGPFCNRVNPALKQVKKEYGDQVRIVWKNMPLGFHAKAPAAHQAAMAAHNQGKFWQMHDKIFADQRNMSEQQYVVYAQELDLDAEKFKKDAADPKTAAAVQEDIKYAGSVGVSGTPAFFINGRYLSGAQPFDRFKSLIDEELNSPS